MKYLTVVNALLLSFCVTMFVVLGVVCLIFAFYLGDDSVRLQLPPLLWSTGVFGVLSAAMAPAFLAVLRRWKAWPIGQLGVVLLAIPCVLLLIRVFG
jgi:hypothetical protein